MTTIATALTQKPGLRRRVGAALESESGIALPAVIGVIVVTFALASVAAVAAVAALSGTNRDSDSKTALAVADAGVNNALARQNLVAGSGASDYCLYEGAGGLLYQTGTSDPDGWCAPVTGNINGATYSYRTRPNADDTLDIAATGTSDGVERRVLVSAFNSGGSKVFGEAALIGLAGVTLSGNATSYASTATNGVVTLNNNANVCAPISASAPPSNGHGGGRCSQSSYSFNSNPVTLPAVQQGNAPTVNLNDEITKAKNGDASTATIAGNPGKLVWDPGTRKLELQTKVSLTLGGGTYSLCELRLNSNTNLFVKAGETVRIFFDAPGPGGCNYDPSEAPIVQLDLISNSQISTTAGDPSKLALLFVGSDEIDTRIQLNSNLQPNESCQDEFIIYAPKSFVDVNSNDNFCGGIGAKEINLDSNVSFSTTSSVENFELPGAGPHYTIDRFIECAAEAGATPDSRC